MKRKKLKRLWAIKKACLYSACVECKYRNYLQGCSAANMYKAALSTYPHTWDLPPLPKKKKFEDRFTLSIIKDHIINRDILKAFRKGYTGIECWVWNVYKIHKKVSRIEGIDMRRDYPYMDQDDIFYKHAEPVQKGI